MKYTKEQIKQEEAKQEQMRQEEKQTQIIADIVSAIDTNNAIEFEYHKETNNSKVRKVNPHNVYWNKDSTKVMLDGFQVSGDSKTNKLQSFKQFDTRFIMSVLILDDKFSINEKYNSKSDRYNKSILGVT